MLVAVEEEPGVEVDAAAKRLETMVGHDNQRAPRTELSFDPADEVVHPLVEVLDDLGAQFRRGRPERRMRFVEVPPEHVLDAVGGLDDADEGSLFCFRKGIKKHWFPFA